MAVDFPLARSSNPAFAFDPFAQARAMSGSDVMTVEGTANKTLLAVAITAIAGWYSWTHLEASAYIVPCLFATVGVAIALVFKQQWAPVLTPVYAIAEGTILGLLSRMFEASYPGVVFQAVGLTMAVMTAMLLAYRSGMIAVTDRFRMGVVAATGGIALFYFIVLLMSLFHANVSFMYGSGLFSIGLSLAVVVIASLNLVLDFDFIARGAASGAAPKYLEWYGAFALLVTIVWLYMELLRLLAKLQSRRD